MKKWCVLLGLTVLISACSLESQTAFGKNIRFFPQPVQQERNNPQHGLGPKLKPNQPEPNESELEQAGPDQPGPNKPHPESGKSGPNKPEPGPYKPGPKPHYKPDFHDQRRLRDDARSIIRRTSFVILEAQHAARRHHYTSGLGRAVAHQEWAQKLYWRGKYRDAIFHSLRARNIAYDVIKGNRERWNPNYDWNDKEDGYIPYAPKDDELDLQIKLKIHNDKEALFLKLNLDLD